VTGEYKKSKLVQMVTSTKYMWVANLVEPWRVESSSIPVIDFFESVNRTAEMGRLNSEVKFGWID
jgi:hypothetical protein